MKTLEHRPSQEEHEMSKEERDAADREKPIDPRINIFDESYGDSTVIDKTKEGDPVFRSSKDASPRLEEEGR
jgi:hypothetical protein